MKLHFLSRQTGCTRSFFTPKPPGCGKGGKSTAFMRVSSPKTTTENCMDYPVWNELFTFSTGFSTVFVKKRRSFQRCFPPFPHSFPHSVGESPIQAVMDAAAFWKFVGKNVGNLPFIKKKVEGFSFVFTVYSGLRVCFSPIWNLPPGSFPQTAGEKNPVWKTDINGGFPHCFYPAGAVGEITPSVIACGDATFPKGTAFGGGDKASGIAQRRPLGGAGAQRLRGYLPKPSQSAPDGRRLRGFVP